MAEDSGTRATRSHLLAETLRGKVQNPYIQVVSKKGFAMVFPGMRETGTGVCMSVPCVLTSQPDIGHE